MKTRYKFVIFILLGVLLAASCTPRARVGALRTESRSVELDDDSSVQVKIAFGAGNLKLSGGAQKLLEADFTYNVAVLKPDVKYTGGKLVVQQPENKGLPVFRDISDFRNEWDLRLNDKVPMELSVNIGAGKSNLQLSGMSLTALDITLGAGDFTIDLRSDWVQDLDAAIDAGAANLTVRLPKSVGVRVEVDRGPTMIEFTGLTQDGDVYKNAAYGESDVTLQVELKSGIGLVNLEVEEGPAE